MKIVRILLKRRRVLALCIATLALHYLALDWFGSHAGVPAAASPRPDSVVSVQLRAVPPVLAPAPAPAMVAPPAARSPVRQRPVTPPAAPAIADGADGADHGAGEMAMQVQSDAELAAETAPETTPESLPESAPVPLPTAVVALDDGPPPRLYRVELPPSADLEMDVRRVDADGTVCVPAAASPRPDSVVSVQLRAVPPVLAPAPAPAMVAPPAARSPVRQRPVTPPAAPAIADGADGADHGAGEMAMQVQSDAELAAETAPETTPESLPESAPVPLPTAVAALDDGPPPRLYRVELPPSADLEMDVRRVDADGTVWNGAGALSWQQDGNSYKTTLEAGLSLLVTRVNLLVISSEGQIDDHGIAPVTATEKRKGRSLTATHFNREQQRITFSASERAYPLLPGSQDKATLPFQLAGIGRADVNQFSGDIDLFVGEDNEANVFRFNLIGEDELDTKMGRLLTWHLSRPPKPGTYSSRLDIWLAPAQGWYPVQIRNTEANGAVTTQSVSRITVTASRGP